MPHGTPLKEKGAVLLNLLSEHAQAHKSKTVCVPVAHLNAKGLDISDVNNILWSLRDKGVIKRFLHCWGAYESEAGSSRTFVPSSTEEAINDGDFEAYEIEIVPAKFERYISEQQPSRNTDKILLRLSSEGDLYKEPRTKFHYPLSAKGVPLKIVRYFADTSNIEYESTDSLAQSLGMKASAVRTEIGKIRNAVKKPLGLGDTLLIESKQNSGYRLNPKITIQLED